jgi:hypothetical protein
MYLVTNVLDKRQLSDRDAVRLYRLRWGVELQFRAVKQTFGRRKLRSRPPERAYVELDWPLVGLWMIQLFAVKEQIAIGEVPEHCSAALAIQVVRTTFQQPSEIPGEAWAKKLQGATKDSYRRKSSKEARYKPEFKDKPAAGKPKVINANRQQRSNARRHRLRVAA